MANLQGRKILLGVCGSVAAFKAAALASQLTKAGATVRVILTASGERFVTAETFRDLTEQPVATSLWGGEVDHIDLAQWADLVVVAPASAHLIARMANGLTDDLLSTVLLATPAPIYLVPAMESQMWLHPATQANVETVRERGVLILGPDDGRLASGAVGPGRMIEPEDIVRAISEELGDGVRGGDRSLDGLRIVVTAGPTQEAIDPVRYISNRSSGKMGYAVALAAHRRGASVALISGPVDASIRESARDGIETVDVVTAAEMKHAVLHAAEHADVIVMAAAVADFRPASLEGNKIKKGAGLDSVPLLPTDDILVALATEAPDVVRIGFAAETRDLIENAAAKLREKDLAMVVANDVSGGDGAVFGSEENTVTILRLDREPERLPRMPKARVAERIVELIPEVLRAARPVS